MNWKNIRAFDNFDTRIFLIYIKSIFNKKEIQEKNKDIVEIFYYQNVSKDEEHIHHIIGICSICDIYL